MENGGIKIVYKSTLYVRYNIWKYVLLFLADIIKKLVHYLRVNENIEIGSC